MGSFLALITDSGVQNVQQILDCDPGEHGAVLGNMELRQDWSQELFQLTPPGL